MLAMTVLLIDLLPEQPGGFPLRRVLSESVEDFPGSPQQCSFATTPSISYFWDPTCQVDKLGCWADGVHVQCRYCGSSPYIGIACPADAVVVANDEKCLFTAPPPFPVYWEPSCDEKMAGCNADGQHMRCRYCGTGNYSNITCPPQACEFSNEPEIPYYWDSKCSMGDLGCNADGFHVECRFCSIRPFESVPCPGSKVGPKHCVFSNLPEQTFYWDPDCEMGILGCWADGLHAECRYCGGEGVYASIRCP